MTLIALDLGTTFIKGAVLDLDAFTILHIRRRGFPSRLPALPPLFYEVDPQSVVANIRELLDELLPLAPACEGVVICTQMHGLVLTTATGAAASNVITWQDQRSLTAHKNGQSYLDSLRAQLSDAEAQALGYELQPSRPLCYLYWMAENNALPATPVYPVGVADFVVANLCAALPAIDHTGAGAHAALNLATMDWHRPLIDRLGLAALQWPSIRSFGAVVGNLNWAGQTIPIFTPVGDHQCAVVGALLGADELSLNISTGSQASVITPAWQPGNYQTRPFFDGSLLNTITGIPAGRALNQLVNLLTELARLQGVSQADPWPLIATAAAAVDDASSVTDLAVNLAFFDSAGGNQGSIQNIREQNLTVGHLFHAAFANMAENYDAAAERLSPGKHWRGLVFSGGLAQKIEVLRRLIQRRFAVPYRLCPTEEDTLLGLLVLGLVATGRQPSVAAATGAVRRHSGL